MGDNKFNIGIIGNSEHEIDYNKRLMQKLAQMYGEGNAKNIYDTMKIEGEEEIKYLMESAISEFNIDFEENSGRSR